MAPVPLPLTLTIATDKWALVDSRPSPSQSLARADRCFTDSSGPRCRLLMRSHCNKKNETVWWSRCQMRPQPLGLGTELRAGRFASVPISARSMARAGYKSDHWRRYPSPYLRDRPPLKIYRVHLTARTVVAWGGHVATIDSSIDGRSGHKRLIYVLAGCFGSCSLWHRDQ
jgi:hypothetical protein